MTRFVTRCILPATCMALAVPAIAAGASGLPLPMGQAGAGAAVVAPPSPVDNGVYITQIGESQTAEVRQSQSESYISVKQRGEGNFASLVQVGESAQFLVLEQDGLLNDARITQSASTGATNVGNIAQLGDQNTLMLNQFASAGEYNGAAMLQQGNSNRMQLDQNGSGNSAVLAQDGNSNIMTAVQNGDGNQLQWIQQGSGLSDLKITQDGGVSNNAISITQTNGGS